MADGTASQLSDILAAFASRQPGAFDDLRAAAVERRLPAGRAAGQVLLRLLQAAAGAGGRVPAHMVQRDVQALAAGLAETAPDAPPPTPGDVLYAYAQLLRLAGYDPETALPHGAWHTYAHYGLREDTARHACESDGFDSFLTRAGLPLAPADRLAALLLAGCALLHGYPLLLESAWRERTAARLLLETAPNLPGAPDLFRAWEFRQPNLLAAPDPALAGMPAYAARRAAAFAAFLEQPLAALSAEQRAAWQARLREAEQRDLPAYLRQMNMLAYLEPNASGEARRELPPQAAQVGVVVRGAYSLVPLVDALGQPLADPALARELAEVMLSYAGQGAGLSALTSLARVRRAAQAGLRAQFSAGTLAAFERLRAVPLLINLASPGGTGNLGRDSRAQRQPSWPRAARQPLGRARMGERGLGDHPLTIFDAGGSLIFDAAAAFFDPAWAAALADVFNVQAAAWALRLRDLAPAGQQAERFSPHPLALRFLPDEADLIENAPTTDSEACAETDSVEVRPALQLRALCKRSPDLPQLALNDLLVLYRGLHALEYVPPESLIADLQEQARVPNPTSRTGALITAAVRAALDELQVIHTAPPGLLLPFDVSPRSPAERLMPVMVRVPPGLARLHRAALHALADTREIGAPAASAPAAAGPLRAEFLRARAAYLTALASYSEAMRQLREALLAGGPAPATTFPERYDLFDTLAGEGELFVNLGALPEASSLRRFLPARDDLPRRMAWGLFTAASGVMHITLRDFRPHVARLHAAGLRDTADRIAQDYLDAYARGFNRFVYDLTRVIRGS